MQTLKKPIVIILILLFIAGITVFRLMKGDDTEEFVSETPEEAKAGEVVGAELIALLKDLKSLNIDSAFFADTVFKRLKDFSVKLELQPGLVRRPNPFAPIGQDIDFVVSGETLGTSSPATP